MTLPAVEIKGGLLRVEVPDGWYSVTLDKPRKPRTTGPRSQNSAVWGYCQAIALQVGMETERVYQGLKLLASRENGYPVEWNAISGEWEPKSQAKASAEEVSILIQAIKHYADTHSLWLIEYIDGQPVKTLYGCKVKAEK